MDADYVAFRALVRQAERDLALATELPKRLAAGMPLRDLLSLGSGGEAATSPASRTPGTVGDGR